MCKPILPLVVFILLIIRVPAKAQSDNLKLAGQFEDLTEDNIFRSEEYFNWGSSILKGDDGKYHLFYSRWKREYNFTGWLTHSEVAHAVSDTPAGPWKYIETALAGQGGDNWDAITAHNPKIKFFDGKYYLYYISTNMGDQGISDAELVETAVTGYKHPNWKILRPNQRTGVAVASSLNGPWERMKEPLIEPSGPITTLTVNPAIDQGADGKFYLIVKGDKPNETRFIRNQAIAVSDSPTGPFVMQDNPVIDYMDTEDMSMWFDEKRNRFYGVFHAHHFIGLLTSEDGTKWEKAGEYELLKKQLRMKDGSTIVPGRMERPFIYVEDGEPKVLSLAVKKGNDSYSIFLPIRSH